MKFQWGAAAPVAVVCLAMVAMSSFARAEGSGAGYGSSKDSEQPGSMAQEQGMSSEPSSAQVAPGMGEKEIKADATTMTLAPHAIAVETALMNAIDQLKGLKAQVRTAQNQPTPEFMSQYKMHTRDIQGALNLARKHEGELKNRAGKFPNVAQSEEFRQLAPAISDAERLSTQWGKQTAASGYWRDNVRVTQDLDALEKRLTNALDKTKSFSTRFDVATVG